MACGMSWSLQGSCWSLLQFKSFMSIRLGCPKPTWRMPCLLRHSLQEACSDWQHSYPCSFLPSKAIRALCLWLRSWTGCGTASSFISCFTLLHFWRIRSFLRSCPYFCYSLQVCLPHLCSGTLFDWVAVRSHVLKYISAHWQWVKQVQARKGISLWIQRRLECGCGCLSQD